MAGSVETTLRGPQAYGLAREALEAMEAHGVWPTPLNFELWIHYIGDRASPLGQEIDRLIGEGQPFTEDKAEELAAAFLPKVRFNEEIRDAGDHLSRELASVSKAITAAQKSSSSYGETLAGVTRELADNGAAPAIKEIVDTLSSATRRVQKENKALEKQLRESTSEVDRLRVHLEQVRRDAMTDALTNLANRKAFDEELERACLDADSNGQLLTLAMIDIDHFKSFNDTWGHQTGDQVIRYVASVIGRMSPAPRFAARYGGEEFGVVFRGESGAVVRQTLENIREQVAGRMLKRRSTAEDLGRVSVSVGFAERWAGEKAEALMERADAALYASKNAGRNRVTAAQRKTGRAA